MTDRDRLIELCDEKIRTMKFQNSDHWFDFTEKIKEIADCLLANGVIVPVRCKDCKYCEKWSDRSIFCNKHIVFMGMNDNDFCSYGELKERER